MFKKALRIILPVFLLAIIAYSVVIWHFYDYSFYSNHIFRLKHRWEKHLYFHLDDWGFEAGDEVEVYGSISKEEGVLWDVKDAVEDTILVVRQAWFEYQPVGKHPSVEGTGWQPSFSFEIPKDAAEGWYILTCRSSQQEFSQSFIIYPDSVEHDFALILPTNTWNAYNFWGGQSLYSRNYSPSVSFLRPQLLANPSLPDTYQHHQIAFQSAKREQDLLKILTSQGFTVDVYTDDDLHKNAERLHSYKALIISTHSEYWTRPMVENLNEYLAAGGSLVSLSGNTAAYISHREAHQLHVWKADTTLWNEVERDGLRPFGLQTHFDAFHTYAPYEVLQDSSWVFEGLNVQQGDLFGEMSDTYDYTYNYGSLWENIQGLRRKGKKGAASGMEIDKVYDKTPANWQTVARGKNPFYMGRGEVYPDELADGKEWNGEGGADMGYYIHPAGGIVFNVGSLAFTGSLPHDSIGRGIVRNVLNRVIHTSSETSHTNPSAYSPNQSPDPQ